MRPVVARVSAGSYPAGTVVRLYGPDVSGALDTTQFSPLGRTPVRAFRTQSEAWLERGWLCGPWLAAGKPGGWLCTPWLSGAWLTAGDFVTLLGETFEYGVLSHAVVAFDAAGNQGDQGSTAKALVNSSPARTAAAAISVAGGVATMTVTEG
jgi:hypothetical protein